eukprot:4055569-Amphidinium_carterae.1
MCERNFRPPKLLALASSSGILFFRRMQFSVGLGKLARSPNNQQEVLLVGGLYHLSVALRASSFPVEVVR